jgi:hypothetical protein
VKRRNIGVFLTPVVQQWTKPNHCPVAGISFSPPQRAKPNRFTFYNLLQRTKPNRHLRAVVQGIALFPLPPALGQSQIPYVLKIYTSNNLQRATWSLSAWKKSTILIIHDQRRFGQKFFRS